MSYSNNKIAKIIKLVSIVIFVLGTLGAVGVAINGGGNQFLSFIGAWSVVWTIVACLWVSSEKIQLSFNMQQLKEQELHMAANAEMEEQSEKLAEIKAELQARKQ